MKLLLFPLVLSYASLAKAQEALLLSKPVMEAIDVAEPLSGKSANLRYLLLKHFTPVYHQLADTVNVGPAFKLFPGTKVYIREYVPRGFLVDWKRADGKQYYLPAKSVKRLRTFVEI